MGMKGNAVSGIVTVLYVTDGGYTYDEQSIR